MMSRFLSPLGDTISKTSGYSILGHPVITQINCYEDAESIFLFYNFLSLTDVRRDAGEILVFILHQMFYYVGSNISQNCHQVSGKGLQFFRMGKHFAY